MKNERITCRGKNKIFILFCIAFAFSLVILNISFSNSEYYPPVFSGFDSLDKGNNRIIFIGDTQGTSVLEFWRENNKEKTPKLIKEIAGRNPALVLNLGDLVFCGTSVKQWKRFDEAHKPLLDYKIPYFCLPGNHEYWCNPKKSFENYFIRFPHLNKQKWYSFTFQKIGFLILDSNFSKLTEVERHLQMSWYSEELLRLNNSPDLIYVIVCCHHPPFTNSKVVKPNEKVARLFVEPFLKLKKTVLFLSGHCHSYEKFIKGNKYFIVSGGGGGPRQRLYTKKENLPFDDKFAGPSLRFLHFCQINIRRSELFFRVVKLADEGGFEIVDRFTIPKPKEDSGGTKITP